MSGDDDAWTIVKTKKKINHSNSNNNNRNNNKSKKNKKMMGLMITEVMLKVLQIQILKKILTKGLF